MKWRLLMFGLLLVSIPAAAQQYKTGASTPAPIAVTGSGVPLTTGYRESFTVMVDESATGCVWVVQHDGPNATAAFANGNTGKRLCRNVAGAPDPAGWVFLVREDGWTGPIFAKPATGYSSVLVTRSAN